ncbi:MAG: hypothetical protein LBE67_04695 [Kocuria palustris]|nr:hypothetical protein [Kocuria palustris]
MVRRRMLSSTRIRARQTRCGGGSRSRPTGTAGGGTAPRGRRSQGVIVRGSQTAVQEVPA